MKSKKNLVKLLVVVLTLALMIGAIAMVASADETSANVASVGDTEYATLAEALDAAEADATVTLIGDVTISSSYTLTKNVTIDLGGKTLTNTVADAFIETTEGLSFSIVGNGKIESAGRIVNAEKTKASFALIGDEKGITVNHTGTKQGGFVSASYGTYRFENFTMTSSSLYNIFNIGADSKADFVGLSISATSGNDNAKSVISVNPTSSTHVSYCNITSLGTSVFGIGGHEVRNNDFLTVKGSYIEAKWNSTTEASANVFYNGYGTCASDIIVEDSYISSNSRLLIKSSVDGSALILKNSTYCYNGGAGALFRSFNVKLEEGSALVGTYTSYPAQTPIFNQEYYSADSNNPGAAGGNASPLTVGNNTNVNLLINVGARFDWGAYNNLVGRTGSYVNNGVDTDIIYYAEGQIAFPDGSSPENSETYGFVYDPFGNPETPYVVVKIEEGVTLPKIPDLGTSIYYSKNPTTAGIYNDTASSTRGNITYLQIGDYGTANNNTWRYVSNGAINSNGLAPNFFFGKNGGVSQELYNVFVCEFDIAADLGGSFTSAGIALYARDQANKTNRSVTMLSLSEDGTVTPNSELKIEGEDGTLVASTVTTKLTLGEWNHITYVIDTTATKGTAYVYVNGLYMGQRNAYGNDDAYIWGPRYDASSASVKKVNTSLYMDNISIRAYGDLSLDGAEATPVENLGADYLVGGGKAWNDGPVGNAISTVTSGVAFSDVEEALAANAALGVMIKLNKSIAVEQTAVSEGKIYANGYEIPLSDTSVPANVIYSADNTSYLYDFNTKYSSVVFYKFFLGDVSNKAQLEDEAYWSDAIKCMIGATPEMLHANSEVTKFLYKNHYVRVSQIGWSTEIGANAVVQEILSPEFADANNGATIKLYPVYDYDNGILQYQLIILNSDGTFNRGVNGTNGGEFYGTQWKTVNLAYGETLVLQKNITSQASMNFAWNQGSQNSDAEDKTFSLDLNGYTITVDPNFSQSNPLNKLTFITVDSGETFNLYSSQPGGKIVSYGINISSTKTSTATYASDATDIPAAGRTVNADNTVVTDVTHTNNSDGTITVTTKVYNITGTSGGALIEFNGGTEYTIADNANGEITQHNTRLNVGTVTAFGTEYLGSNLTVEGCNIVNVRSGDSTCEINVDGITAIRNSEDYAALFMTRRYFGKLNIANATLITPQPGSSVLWTHSEGFVDENNDKIKDPATELALTEILFDNCTIIVSEDGANIFGIQSGKSVTFTNCVTNGRINGTGVPELQSTFKINIDKGNVYVATAYRPSEDYVAAGWNNAMTIPGGAETITANYITLVDGNTYSNSSFDYKINSYVIAISGYEGEADKVLPIIPYKTVAKSDALTVTYKAPNGSVAKTETYAPGASVIAAPGLVADEAIGNVLKYDQSAWDITLPILNITESLEIDPIYEVVANISGIKANLSIYADFGVNIYLPISYKDYVTAALVGEDKLLITDVDLNNDGTDDHIKVTVTRAAKDAAKDVKITFALSEVYDSVTYTPSATVTLNVVSYAEKVLALDDVEGADDALMYQMLNYANEAIMYAGADANAEITKLLEGKTLTNYADSISDNDICDTSLLSAAFAGATVDTSASLAYAFVLKDGFAGTVTVSYGDITRSFTVTAEDSRTIRLDGMKVYNFAYDLTVKAEGTIDNEAVTVNGTYNLATFVNYHIEEAAKGTEASVACVDLAKAFYNYAKNAYEYMNPSAEA